MVHSTSTTCAAEIRQRVDILAAAIRAGFPPHAVAALQRDLHVSPAVADLRQKLDRLLGGVGDAYAVYIHGQPGTGKTFEATRAGVMVHAAGGRSIFRTTLDFLGRVNATYRNDAPETAAAVVDELAGAPLLVLDDIGAERATPHAVARLFEVLDGRYTHFRPTIITSNYKPGALVRRLAGSDDDTQARRIADRLLEMTVRAEIPGDTLRRTVRPVEWATSSALLDRLSAHVRVPRHVSEAEQILRGVAPSAEPEPWETEAAALLPDQIIEASRCVNIDIFRRWSSMPARGTRPAFDPMRTVV